MTHRLIRGPVASACTAGLIALATAGPAAAAGGGYGPGAAAGGTAPGFGTVVSAKTFSLTGGSLSARTAGGLLKISVPNKATTSGLQVAITKGTIGSVVDHLNRTFRDYRVLEAFGVEFLTGAQPTTLNREATVTFSASFIKKGEEVLVYNGATGKFTLLGNPQANGYFTIHLKAGETVAIVEKQ